MALPEFLTMFTDTMHGITGNIWIFAIIILLFIIIGFMFAGVDFRYATLFASPVAYAFSQIGWFPGWVGTLFWLVIGLGVFIMIINIVR